MKKPMKLVYAAALAIALCSAGAAEASNYALEEIPQAVPSAEAARLKAQGIGTTFQLLERASDAKARKELAKATKIPEKTLETWVQMADVMRVKGVGPDVTRLLGACGVRTVAQLKTQDATRLNDDIMKVNSKQHLSENPPSVEHLQAWIAQAQTLPIVLH
ncbi:MAG: Pathogenicity locus [Myxococcales bacterium]|nr:Pathogenicity locus [Myxococcales bacterium]